MKKFLVVDGNSIMNRAFYALSPRTTMYADGIYTNAIYGFLNIYWMIENMISPEYTAVAFDLKAPTFRHALYQDYKGTRKGMPEELKPQMTVIKEVLTALNIPILEKEGYEADDILGTISKHNEQEGIETYILSGDRDSYQLISDHTFIVMPSSKMGKTEYTVYDKEKLNEKYQITPSQVVDVKALMGDTSDNIPGVKGIGEKTAYSLIKEYNTLYNVYEKLESLQITNSVKEKLNAGKEMAFLSYQLGAIVTQVPIPISYPDCEVSGPNLQKLYQVFSRYKFNKFMAKYDFSKIDKSLIDQQSNVDNTVIKEKTPVTYITQENLSVLYSIFENEKQLSYYLHLKKEEHKTNVLEISFDCLTLYDGKTIYCAILNNLKNPNELLTAFTMSISQKIGYHIKQDLRYFFDIGITTINGFSFDAMIAFYLLDSNTSNYPMPFILRKEYDLDFVTSNQAKDQISLFDQVNVEDKNELEEYQEYNLSLYLKSLYYMKDRVLKRLESRELLSLFETIEMPLSETLASMESYGMYIDQEKLHLFDHEISEHITTLENTIYELAGEVFNINSTKQLGKLLFEKLKLPTVKKNKTGYSTDKDVLDELSDQHAIIPYVLEYRTLNKLKSTYVDGLKGKIEQDGRIHTTFMQTVTSTGRLSSIEPNLQNIPIRLEIGSKIRTFFVGQKDCLLIDSDYSQIELRVLASMSQDTTMIDAFIHKQDIHSVTASQVFDVPLEQVTKEMRGKAKAVNFGIVYGISDFGLAKNIDISRNEASLYIENYLNKYPNIKKYMEQLIKEAKENEYVSTLYGRRRYIPEILSSNRNIVKFGERVAMNTPIQGSAADIIKIAMNNIYASFKEKKLRSRLVMQVHDELIVEAYPEEVKLVTELMREKMQQACVLKVPLVADINSGKSWYDAK